MLRSWGTPVFVVFCGAVVAASQFVEDLFWPGTVEFLVFVGLASVVSPVMFPRSISAAEARRLSATDGRTIVYWRPGCRYCLRLRARLGRAARGAYWVNIWSDPAGAAAVRAVADGNETVPTVVLDGESFVHPDPDWVRERLQPRR